jgi:hypothetical protein
MMKTTHAIRKFASVAATLLIIVVLYSLYAPVIYRYAPGVQAVIEHVTHYPPGLCRVLNVKALHGSGELRWVVIHNKKSNTTIEHVRAYKDGRELELSCPEDTCRETFYCGTIKIENYRVIPTSRDGIKCNNNNTDLGKDLFIRYLNTALVIDKILDHI